MTDLSKAKSTLESIEIRSIEPIIPEEGPLQVRTEMVIWLSKGDLGADGRGVSITATTPVDSVDNLSSIEGAAIRSAYEVIQRLSSFTVDDLLLVRSEMLRRGRG